MDLPHFHYNHVKRDNKAIFKFLEHFGPKAPTPRMIKP